MQSHFKNALGLFQCVSAMPSVMDVRRPLGVEGYTAWLSILQWPNDIGMESILPAECYGGFHRRLLISSLWPLALVVLAVIGCNALDLVYISARRGHSLLAKAQELSPPHPHAHPTPPPRPPPLQPQPHPTPPHLQTLPHPTSHLVPLHATMHPTPTPPISPTTPYPLPTLHKHTLLLHIPKRTVGLHVLHAVVVCTSCSTAHVATKVCASDDSFETQTTHLQFTPHLQPHPATPHTTPPTGHPALTPPRLPTLTAPQPHNATPNATSPTVHPTPIPPPPTPRHPQSTPHLRRGSCHLMRSHAISCDLMRSHAISRDLMRSHAISCDLMRSRLHDLGCCPAPHWPTVQHSQQEFLRTDLRVGVRVMCG